MADLNKVFLIGRLTHDPELRYTAGQTAVTTLRLATSRQYQGRDGTLQKETLYIDVEVWARQAENCCQYLRKGSQVHAEGHLRLDSWDDKQTGQKRSQVRAVAERVQFLDSRRDDPGGAVVEDEEMGAAPRRPMGEPRGAYNGPASASPSRPPATDYEPPSAPARRPAPPPVPETDPEDDIPF